MYEQRAAPEEEGAEPLGLWAVRVHFADGSSETVLPDVEDWYVAIDDLAFGRVVFDAAHWPRVDGSGRLAYGPAREARVAESSTAQPVIDGARAEHGQELRPLRIGDVFLVRGPDLSEDIREWRIRGDVTRAARDAAKLALFAAVAPRLRPEEEEMLPEPPPEPEVDPETSAGGHSFPAV